MIVPYICSYFKLSLFILANKMIWLRYSHPEVITKIDHHEWINHLNWWECMTRVPFLFIGLEFGPQRLPFLRNDCFFIWTKFLVKSPFFLILLVLLVSLSDESFNILGLFLRPSCILTSDGNAVFGTFGLWIWQSRSKQTIEEGYIFPSWGTQIERSKTKV